MATVSFTEQPKGNNDMSRYSEQAPKDVLPAAGKSVLAKAQVAFAELREAERSENANVQQLARFLNLEVPMTAKELLQFSQEVQKNSADNGELSPEQLKEVRWMATQIVEFIRRTNRPEQTPLVNEQVSEAKGGVFIPPGLKDALRRLSRSAAVLLVVIVTMACTVQPAGASSESASAVIELLEKEVDALPVTPTPTKTPAPTRTPTPTATPEPVSVTSNVGIAELPTATPEPEETKTYYSFSKDTNMRKDAGTDTDIIAVAKAGDSFEWTGERKTNDDKEIWVQLNTGTDIVWVLEELVTPTIHEITATGHNMGGSAETTYTIDETDAQIKDVFTREPIAFLDVNKQFPEAIKDLKIGTRLINQFLPKEDGITEDDVENLIFFLEGPTLFVQIGDELFFREDRHQDYMVNTWYWQQNEVSTPGIKFGLSIGINPLIEGFPPNTGLHADGAMSAAVVEQNWNSLVSKIDPIVAITDNSPENVAAETKSDWLGSYVEGLDPTKYQEMIAWATNNRVLAPDGTPVETRERMQVLFEVIQQLMPEVKRILIEQGRLLHESAEYIKDKSGKPVIGIFPEQFYIFDEKSGVLTLYWFPLGPNKSSFPDIISEITGAAIGLGHKFSSDEILTEANAIGGLNPLKVLAELTYAQGTIDGQAGLYPMFTVKYKEQ